MNDEFSIPSFSDSEAGEILSNVADDINQSVKKSVAAIQTKRQQAREAELLQTPAGVEVLIQEHLENKLALTRGSATNAAAWNGKRADLVQRRTLLEEQNGLQDSIGRMNKAGELESPRRKRLEKELHRVNVMLSN